MGLLRMYIRADLNELHANGVEIKIIGAKTQLDGDILGLIDEVHTRTKGNTNLKLTIATVQNRVISGPTNGFDSNLATWQGGFANGWISNR